MGRISHAIFNFNLRSIEKAKPSLESLSIGAVPQERNFHVSQSEGLVFCRTLGYPAVMYSVHFPSEGKPSVSGVSLEGDSWSTESLIDIDNPLHRKLIFQAARRARSYTQGLALAR